ncbi:unnamed protein product, partial [Laminaria digitata]
FTSLAIVYWIRIKNSACIRFFFITRCKQRTIYFVLRMILCIHLSLKWHGYDEMYNCEFLYDLKSVFPDMNAKEHCCKMEVEILNSLDWKLLID